MPGLKQIVIYLWVTGLCLAAVGIAPASADTESAPGKGVESEPAQESSPSLADVVYQAGSLGQRLIELKSRIGSVTGTAGMEQQLEQAKTRMDRFQERLERLNAQDLQSYPQLAALRGEVRDQADSVGRVVASLTESIKAVESLRQQWAAEKKRWARWRSQLGEDMALKSVGDAFTRSDADIDGALNLITRKLEPLLAVQEKAGDVAARIKGLTGRIDSMMAEQRGSSLSSGTPIIFSVAYLGQVIDLVLDPGKLIKPLPAPEAAFFSSKGWVIGLQLAVFGVLFGLLRRYRPALLGHVGRRFLGRRPVSVSLFVSIFSLAFLYGPQPAIWRMLIQTLAGGTAARVVAAFVREAWVKRAIYILILVMIAFQTMLILGLPLAPMRLFILIWTVAGAVYYAWRARQGAGEGRPGWVVWLLRLIVLAFGFIAAVDVIGLGGFSVQLMDGAIRTAVLMLMGWTMIRLARVALEMGVESLPFQDFGYLRNNANAILSRAILVCNVLIAIFVAANMLTAWKLYAIPMEALQDIFTFGFAMEGRKITVGLVLVAAGILYAAFVLSRGVQNVLMDNVLGFFIALSALGFELKNITIIGGALGVGIGFGMQTIVNNFVCGLILLFERPIKVGDVIQLTDGQKGRVLNLGLRATIIQTFDRAEIVVPNNDLIASQVVNWTLGDRNIRLIIPVGVAYGSDVQTVMRVLMEVAEHNAHVLKEPRPMVLFLSFGDSSLDFELRAWIADFNDRRIIQSELVCEIDRCFRIEGIEIPFPQRDVHIRPVGGQTAD